MNEIKVKVYSLKTENGNYLGQIVVTSNGMFASVTDYGNLSFQWHTGIKEDFRSFILSINESYFGSKMFTGMAYIAHSRKIEKACDRFAEKILPSLKKALQLDLNENPNWD